MCLILARDRRLPLPDWAAALAATRNPDGVGALWHAGGRWHAERLGAGGAHSRRWRRLLRELERVEVVALHWRLATSGPTTAAAAHPHPVRGADGAAYWLMHNGHLAIPHRPDESDTAALARALGALPSSWPLDERLRALVEAALAGDRLLVTDPERPVLRLLGRWHDWHGWRASQLACLSPVVVRPAEEVAWSWVNVGGRILPSLPTADD